VSTVHDQVDLVDKEQGWRAVPPALAV